MFKVEYEIETGEIFEYLTASKTEAEAKARRLSAKLFPTLVYVVAGVPGVGHKVFYSGRVDSVDGEYVSYCKEMA